MDWDKFFYGIRNYRSLYESLKVGSGVNIAKLMGVCSLHGSLSAVVCRGYGNPGAGSLINLGLLGKRVVTDAGVAMLVDYWDAGTPAFTNMNFHDSGTGGTAEGAGQTDLVTPAGPTTRATGTKSQPSANIFQTVGTIAYTGTLSIVEHGLFDNATRAAENAMWDRTLFTSIGVDSGDSIQFTYQNTFTAGS